MANPNNHGMAPTARLAAAPVAFDNANGSKSVKFNAYLDDNFKSQSGQWGSQKIPFEAYVHNGANYGNTPFASAREGDLVNINYHLENGSYRDKNTGEMVYAGARVVVDDIWFAEPKSVRDARAAEKAAKAQGQAQQAAAPAQTQAAQPVQAQPVAQPAQVAVPAQVAQPTQQTTPAAPQQVAVPAQAANAIADNPPF